MLGNRVFHAFGEQGVEFCDFRADEGDSVVLTKYVAMFDGRDTPADELHATTCREVEDFVAEGFEREFEVHADIYRKMWGQANIDIEGDPELDRAIRLNVFHLMSTANEHDDRVNVGAKLLTGEEYGGHAFWDTELFMLPFFAYVFPQTARHLESYRYRLLGAARPTRPRTDSRVRNTRGNPLMMAANNARTGPSSRMAPATAAMCRL